MKNKVKQFMALGVGYLDQYIEENDVKDGYIRELYEFTRRDLFALHDKNQQQVIRSIDTVLDTIIELQGEEIEANLLALSISAFFIVYELEYWKGSKNLKAKRLLWGIYNDIEKYNSSTIGFYNSNELVSRLDYKIKG